MDSRRIEDALVPQVILSHAHVRLHLLGGEIREQSSSSLGRDVLLRAEETPWNMEQRAVKVQPRESRGLGAPEHLAPIVSATGYERAVSWHIIDSVAGLMFLAMKLLTLSAYGKADRASGWFIGETRNEQTGEREARGPCYLCHLV